MSRFPDHLVTPNWSLAQQCAEKGMFLQSDYLQAMNDSFLRDHPRIKNETGHEGYFGPTRVVIVGARSVPLVTTRAVWLARTTFCEKITVKVPSEDEELLLKQMWEEWPTPIDLDIHRFDHEQPPSDFKRDLHDATHLMVYGGKDSIEQYRRESGSHPWQKIIEFGPKFSFSIIDRPSEVNLDLAVKVATDFVTYWGQGCMSPRFCIYIGEEDGFKNLFSLVSQYYERVEPHLKKFWQKLPVEVAGDLVSHSETAELLTGHKYVEKVNPLNFDEHEIRYGTVKLAYAEDFSVVEELVTRQRGLISTVGAFPPLSHSNEMSLIRSGVHRLCKMGYMQRPSFWHYHDGVDEIAELQTRVEYW